MLKQCDQIGERIHGVATREYRKLAMWEGPFEEFIYFDVDTLVLKDARFVFDFLSSYDFIASQSHIPENRKYVWKNSISKTKALNPDQIRYSASTGFIASKKRTLGVRMAFSKLPRVMSLRKHMALAYKEQAFLNYLVITSPLRRTSLSLLAAQNTDLRIPLERWAGARAKSGRNVLFIHWAGLWKNGMHKKSAIWRRYHRGRLA